MIRENLLLGVITAQFLFLGFWGALAPERSSVRIAVVALLFGLLLSACFIVVWLSNMPAVLIFGVEAGKCCGLSVISLLLLRALRPWCGWRLGWRDSPPEERNRRYSILDLMTWTAAVAIPLGIAQSLFGQQRLWLLSTVLFIFSTALPVSLPAFWWAVNADRRRRWLACLLIWSLLGPFVVAVGWYQMSALRSPFHQYLMMGIVWSAFYAPLVLVWVGNVLALQQVGLRAFKARASTDVRPAGNG